MKRVTLLLTILIIFISITGISLSNDKKHTDTSDIKTQLLANTNIGTDFWFSIPPVFYNESAANNNFIKLYIISSYSTLVKVEVPGREFTKSGTTMPNKVISFSIDPGIGQPFVKDGYQHAPIEQVYSGKGIHITANDPIICYVVCRYSYTSDGLLAIPTSALGKEYIAAPYQEDSLFSSTWGYYLPGMITITAPFDSTNVSFTMGGNSHSTTSGGLIPGQSTTFTLKKGDVWVVCTNGENNDLSGSKIVSDKPVSVNSGNSCTDIPVGNLWCDYTIEQDMPEENWGKFYLVPQIPDRGTPSIIRIFAKDSNTVIYRNGVKLTTLNGKSGLINEGWLNIRMTDSLAKCVVISSNNPINVVLFNTGSSEDMSEYGSNHDPFSMEIFPVEEFGQDVTFCLPGTKGGEIFNDNNLLLVYEADSTGNTPDDLLMGTYTDNSIKWERIKDKYDYDDAPFNTKINGKHYSLKHISFAEEYGVFRIKSSKLFTAYLYGFGNCDSYGYPAGLSTSLVKCNDTISPVVTINYPDSTGNLEDYNYIVKGIVNDDPDNTGTQSNLSSVILVSTKSYNYYLLKGDFTPGISASTTWELHIIDRQHDAKATLFFADVAGNYSIKEIYYKAGKFKPFDTLAPQVQWTMDCDGNVSGTAVDMPSNSLIRSNLAYVALIDSNNYTLTIDTLAIGKSESLNWSLKRINSNHDASATITFSDLKGNDTTISLFYSAALKCSISTNNAFVFNNLFIGDHVENLYTIRNISGKSFALDSIYMCYNNGGFNLTKPDYPKIFSPNDVIVIAVSLNAKAFNTCSICYVDSCGSHSFFSTYSYSYLKTDVYNISNYINNLNIYQSQNSNDLNISFELNKAKNINLVIYDIYSRKISEIINNQFYSNGIHEINFDISDLTSGVYFVRLMSASDVITKKIIIIK